MAAAPEPPTHRQRCYRCWRPLALCGCADIPCLRPRTRVVVLQHPHERTHPFGTARLVRMALPDAVLHVPPPDLHGDLRCTLPVPEGAAVLFPHRDARDLATLPPHERPRTLIAIDGTWAHARRLWRHNPWLHALPHVRLQPAAPSRYRIRREPRADYISTVEAIVQALRLLEPDLRGLDDLLLAFDRMIDRQIAVRARVQRQQRRKEPRQRASRRVPAALHDAGLLVVYVEATRPGGDETALREVLQCTAVRVRDGAVLDLVLQPGPIGPDDEHLFHTRLSRAELAAGLPLAAACAQLAAFAGPKPVLAAWTASLFDFGAPLFPAAWPRVVLKTAYTNVRGHAAGYLEAVLAREGLSPVPLAVRGRAGDRLGNATAVAHWLRRFVDAEAAVSGSGTGGS